VKEKKLAKIFYADLWGLRDEKYDYLLKNDVRTTNWQELKPIEPYYFFVPKDFALQEEYGQFWKITEIFKKWSSGVTTHRDYFVVGFTKEEIIQRLRIFTGDLPDDFVKEALKLKDTGTWKLNEARKKIKIKGHEDDIFNYNYRPFDIRFICYEPILIDRPRLTFMDNLKSENMALLCMREVVIESGFSHIFISNKITDRRIFLSNRGAPYLFPLYLYIHKQKGQIFSKNVTKQECAINLKDELIYVLNKSLSTEPPPEQIFYYIYAVLYSPTYRKRYEEFLKIDFPRIPLPKNYKSFKSLSSLGQELVDLHLLRHPSLAETEIGFPESGSNIVDRIRYDEKAKRVYINRAQYFEGVSSEVWKYRIGAYQVLHKYLKDRKGRKLSLDEINHYMKVAKAIRLTIEIQDRIDKVYKKIF